jgi:HEAT repeat protein
VEALPTAEPQVYRLWLLKVVAALGDSQHLPLLLEGLEHPLTAAEAAEGLARIGDAQALPALQKALGLQQDAVAKALACFGEPGFRILREGLQSQDPHVRQGAARGLAWNFDEEARPLLEQASQTDEDPHVRFWAKAALVRMRRHGTKKNIGN